MVTYRGIITLKTKTTTQLIVTSGLELFANGVTTGLDYCHLGSGSTPATLADTGLETPAGNFSNLSPIAGATLVQALTAPYWFGSRREYFFPAGTFNKEPLTEIGFFNSSQTTLFSRTLITDTEDNVTPIYVLNDEDLTVTYEVRKYPPDVDVVETFDLGATTHTMTIRAARSTDSASWGIFETLDIDTAKLYETNTLGSIEGIPVGASEVTPVASDGSGTGYTITLNIPPDVANYGTGIGAVVLGNTSTGDMYQISFTPKLPKTSDVSLYLSQFLNITWGNR